MKKTIKGFFILCTLIILGCSQVHDQQVWKVKNNSSTDIYVEFTHDYYSETKLDTIKPGEVQGVYYKEGKMEGEDLGNPTMFINVLIYNSTDSLTKNENLCSNWEVTLEKMRSNHEELDCKYEFTVSNSDF